MIRSKPPALANWMLDHLTPAGHDDALAGDLLEEYRAGRSVAWYWRQVLGALLFEWIKHVRKRKREPELATTSGLTLHWTIEDSHSLHSFAGFLVGAGLVNALIASILLCRLPDNHAPSLQGLLLRATIYVALAAFAGIAGARLYWNRSRSTFRTHPPVPFIVFALTCATGWVWVPAAVLLSRQDSPASPLIAALAAALLAIGLRRVIPSATATAESESSHELFEQTLRAEPFETHGYLITLCLYAGIYALENQVNVFAAIWLAGAAFLFAWKRTLAPAMGVSDSQLKSRAQDRLVRVASVAVVFTMVALLFGVAHRGGAGAALAASTHPPDRKAASMAASEIYGYQSIILWPPPQKDRIEAPLPANPDVLAPGSTRPLVIHFDGPYWYFQAPNQRPGMHAHQAHGIPTGLDIRANNPMPLTMEADQTLSTPIPLARCREIQLDIQNRDNQPGPIAIALFLTDSSAPGKPVLNLGEEPVITSQPGQFRFKSAPVSETLHFTVPPHANIKKFNEITVLFLPEIEHMDLGIKIAIQDFALLPR